MQPVRARARLRVHSFKSSAFTLIELLVVIAIIAILAALLLPVLDAGKRAGQSAACKSSLHQLAVALNLYTGDFQKYPLCVEQSRTRTTFVLWESKLLPFAGNNEGLFLCAANKTAPKWTNNPARPWRNPSYGYNSVGTGRYPSGPAFGLDGSPGQPPTRYLTETQVRMPAEMVALIDCKPKTNGSDGDMDDLFPINVLAELAPRHNQGENASFCDAHVEYAKHVVWMQKSQRVKERWNSDHNPHPETWGNN